MIVRLLVISSCTGSKLHAPAGALAISDFQNPTLLAHRQVDLRQWCCSAETMYTGQQHLYMMEGIRTLRRAGVEVDLKIVSAGYGLVDEAQEIAPYNVTFSGMTDSEIRPWADHLSIPGAIRQSVKGHSLVFFLLGKQYLTAIKPPLQVSTGQRLVFFAKPAESRRLHGPGITLAPAGQAECGRFHSGTIALKGAMFRALAMGIASAPERHLAAIQSDSTDQTLQMLLTLGLAAGGGRND
jgi:hypothetical protein